MAGHTSEKRWASENGEVGISDVASTVSRDLVKTLTDVEERYKELLEVYNFAGGDNEGLANLLFKEDIALRSSPNNVPSVEELTKAGDLVAAMTSAHEIYLAATNGTVTAADRLAVLRRMT